MNKREFIETMEKCALNQERIDRIDKLYNISLKGLIAKAISYADSVDFFDEERRALSFEEILNASEELETDFINLGIIPIVDAYDCVYIVFSSKDNKWARFSTVDKTLYRIKDSLEDVL